MGFQSKTYSLSDEVVAWLEELRSDYGSINKGLLAVMALSGDGSGSGEVLAKPGFVREPKPFNVTLSDKESSSDPREIPGVSVGMPPRKEVAGGFPCRCVHSGCRGSKFTGTSRFQNLCEPCRDSGHSGEPRNCSQCANDSATGAL